MMGGDLICIPLKNSTGFIGSYSLVQTARWAYGTGCGPRQDVIVRDDNSTTCCM